MTGRQWGVCSPSVPPLRTGKAGLASGPWLLLSRPCYQVGTWVGRKRRPGLRGRKPHTAQSNSPPVNQKTDCRPGRGPALPAAETEVQAKEAASLQPPSVLRVSWDAPPPGRRGGALRS